MHLVPLAAKHLMLMLSGTINQSRTWWAFHLFRLVHKPWNWTLTKESWWWLRPPLMKRNFRMLCWRRHQQLQAKLSPKQVFSDSSFLCNILLITLFVSYSVVSILTNHRWNENLSRLLVLCRIFFWSHPIWRHCRRQNGDHHTNKSLR